jgi:chemotaxis protein methyltransferase CheR
MALDGAVGQFRALLATGLGWTFADNDVPHLTRELNRRSQERGLGHAAYLARLAAGGWPEELSVLAERLAITETYFFRHGEQFRALSEVALPERIAAGGARRVLRMLSVGCSSGEEAYSLAIAARGALPDQDWAVSVLGLDANPAMLRKAGAACYPAWSLRETPDEVRQAYFRQIDGLYQVDARIRAAVRFREHNVAEAEAVLWHAGQYDVIFCRNLLMYLTPEAAAGLIRRMTLALVPGGYLFLGHTDSLGSRPDGLQALASHSTFYYRRPPVRVPDPVARLDPLVARPPLLLPPPPEADNRILALVREERFAEALREIEKIDQVRPADQLTHGVLLAQAGRLAEAEALVRGLVDTGGLYADAHHLLGVCLEGGGSVDGAIGQFRLAAYLDPAFAMPRLRLGLLARRRGDDRNAAAELDRALYLMRDEPDERIVLFGGGFGRATLTALCRTALDACAVRR